MNEIIEKITKDATSRPLIERRDEFDSNSFPKDAPGRYERSERITLMCHLFAIAKRFADLSWLYFPMESSEETKRILPDIEHHVCVNIFEDCELGTLTLEECNETPKGQSPTSKYQKGLIRFQDEQLVANGLFGLVGEKIPKQVFELARFIRAASSLGLKVDLTTNREYR